MLYEFQAKEVKMNNFPFIMAFVSILNLGLLSCDIFSSNQANFETRLSVDYQYMPGEVLVVLEEEFTLKNLREVLEDLEAEWSRPLADGYVIQVPDDQEKLWVQQLEEEKVIHNAQLNRFGYSYSISAAESGNFPVIENDLLKVEITYSGCSAGHEYALEYEVKGFSSFALWLFKKTPDEPCRAIIRDTRSFKNPQELINAQNLVLLNPVNDKIFLSN